MERRDSFTPLQGVCVQQVRSRTGNTHIHTHSLRCLSFVCFFAVSSLFIYATPQDANCHNAEKRLCLKFPCFSFFGCFDRDDFGGLNFSVEPKTGQPGTDLSSSRLTLPHNKKNPLPTLAVSMLALNTSHKASVSTVAVSLAIPCFRPSVNRVCVLFLAPPSSAAANERAFAGGNAASVRS